MEFFIFYNNVVDNENTGTSTRNLYFAVVGVRVCV
jgi:flagellar biosynthesis regulator FlbT